MEPIQETRHSQRLYAPSRASLRQAGMPAGRRVPSAAGPGPWTSDHPWRPAGQDADYRMGAGSGLGVRAAALAAIALANLALLTSSHLLQNLALVLDLFGVAVFFDFALRLWHTLRRPRMRWTTFPAFVGGKLECVFVPCPVLEPVGAVRTVLRCVRDQRTIQPDSGEPVLEPTVLYQQISEVNIVEDRLKELPLAFDLPGDLPGTDLAPEEATYWQVALRIPVVGPDFETVFLAPVYAPPTSA